MAGLLILLRRSIAAGVAWALVGTSPALADVLEISDGSAQWLNGPLSEQLPVALNTGQHLPGATAASVEIPEGVALVIPQSAVADPARHAAGIPPQFAAKVAELAERFDLSPALLEALVWQESRWRPDAVSHAGARGLAQLMPGTARDLGVNPDDPFANLEGGARYLRQQLDRFDGNLEKALAAYNAGPGRVIRADGIPRIRETQLYVAAIMGRLSNHSRQDTSQ